MHNFSKAIRNTIIFLLIIITIALTLPFLYFEYSMSNWTSKSDIVERNIYSGNISTVFLGASHGLKAFVPQIYDEELGGLSYNLCGSLCTMKGRYTLLKEELERNPIDTVYLEVSYNSLSRDRNSEGPEGDIYVVRRLTTYDDKLSYAFDNFRLNEWKTVYFLFSHYALLSFVESFTSDRELQLSNSLAKRGYEEADSNNLEPFAEDNSIVSFSEEIVDENLEYINAIFELCKEKSVEVVLVTVPLSDRMIKNTDNLDIIKQYYEQIAEKYGCEYYDFNLWKEKRTVLLDSTDFYDDFHLSISGAEKFSNIFASLMKKKQEGIDISQDFFLSYEEGYNLE